MAIQGPISDLARSTQHETDQSWPETVLLQLIWRDSNGKPISRTEIISADQFFGLNGYGAPLEGAHLIQAIERMRRAGPPKPMKKVKK